MDVERMLTANMALDEFGIVLTLIPAACILSGRRYKQRLNQYFLGVAVSNIFMILGDLTDWMFQSTAEQWEKTAVGG